MNTLTLLSEKLIKLLVNDVGLFLYITYKFISAPCIRISALFSANKSVYLSFPSRFSVIICAPFFSSMFVFRSHIYSSRFQPPCVFFTKGRRNFHHTLVMALHALLPMLISILFNINNQNY